ncbi:MAG: hypothetical protein RLZZ67_309 [Candidatus Parcubacteria bacterium]|jgi:uncharacterized protein YqgC (DUF456 family)
MASTVALILASILIVPGVLMAFVPMLPALSYMFVIALVFAIYGGFAVLTVNEILILLGIVFVSIIIDHSSGVLGAKYGGAHTKSLLWGMLCAFIGTLLLPPLGSFVGLFLGVLLAELYYKKSRDKALKAAGSALLGSAVGVGVNIVLAITFLGIFIYFALP